jgi:hypothetical protein
VRGGRVAVQVQLDAVVGTGLGEQVHHPQHVAVVVPGDQRDPVTALQQDVGERQEFTCADGHRDAVLSHRFTGDRGGDGAVPVTMAVACSSSGASGHRVRPTTPQATSAAISA